MTRPHKCRRVCGQPRINCFEPKGVQASGLEEVRLSVDEFEALRLADLEGLYQEEAALEMGVSRQTFGNIINAAHRKLADVIVNIKCLKITGGAVEFDAQSMACPQCKHRRKSGKDGNALECGACLKAANESQPKSLLVKRKKILAGR